MSTFTRTNPREAWLNAAAVALAPAFAQLQAPLPERVRITMSLPRRSNTVGTCFSSVLSDDQTVEIVISLVCAEPLEVMAILAHELVHAAVGLECGHKGPFARVARALGLEGPLTATHAGPGFVALVKPILAKLGAFPHAALHLDGDVPIARRTEPGTEQAGPAAPPTSSAPRKQGTRMIKLACGTCGYVARTTKKWIDDVGPLHCPAHGEMAVEGKPGEDAADEENRAA